MSAVTMETAHIQSMFPYQEAQCADRYVGGCGRIHLDIGEVSHHQPVAGQRRVDVQVALVGGVIRYRHQLQGGLTGCWEDWVSCLELEGGVEEGSKDEREEGRGRRGE